MPLFNCTKYAKVVHLNKYLNNYGMQNDSNESDGHNLFHLTLSVLNGINVYFIKTL